VDRLARTDPDVARELRAAWVRSRQDAADHLGAVEAAWPEPSLRRIVLPDIEAGIAIAGPASGQLFAYLAAARPSAETSEHATALLADNSPERRRARDGFIQVLPTLPGADAAEDRRVCSAAVRTVIAFDRDDPARTQLCWPATAPVLSSSGGPAMSMSSTGSIWRRDARDLGPSCDCTGSSRHTTAACSWSSMPMAWR
jgi:hypothetical protein